MRAAVQPGRWLGPVTRLGRLGPACKTGLDSTKKERKKKNRSGQTWTSAQPTQFVFN